MKIPSITIPSVSGPTAPTPPISSAGGPSFVRTLTEAASNVNRQQLESAELGKQLGAGNAESLHKVVLDAEEASLSMQMVVSLRNKALDAYQEVMRMQV